MKHSWFSKVMPDLIWHPCVLRFYGPRIKSGVTKRRHYEGMLIALFVVLAFTPFASATHCDPHRPLTMLVTDPLALENACACVEGYAQRDYHSLAFFLSQRLGQRVNVVFASTVGTGQEKCGQDPDLIVGKKTVLEHEFIDLGLATERLAMLTDKTGSVMLHGLWVVRAKAKAKTLTDLKHQKLMFGPASANEKHSAALAALKQAGVTVPSSPATCSACSEGAMAVVRQEVDAAVISSYALPLLEGCETIAKGELRVVGRTQDVPFIAAYVTEALPLESVSRVEQALLAVKQDKALLQKLESQGGFVSPQLLQRKQHKAWGDWRGSVERFGLSDYVPQQLPQALEVVWRKATQGQSLGGIAATNDRVIFSDKSRDGKEDIWTCLDAQTGQELWCVRYAAEADMDYGSAPRATPVLADKQVYLLGALGDLTCVELTEGKTQWQINLIKAMGGEIPTWGFSGTPLVLENKVIVQGGDASTALIALHRDTGKILWRTAGRVTAYSSLVPMTLGGRYQIVGYDCVTAGGWDVTTGERLWTLFPRERNDFNVATPLQVNDKLLLATENNGTRLYTFNADGTIINEPVAENEDLAPDMTSPLFCDGRVWGSGIDGLVCLDAENRLREVWRSTEDACCDYTALIAGNGHLLIATVVGKLGLIATTPQKGERIQWLTVFPAQGDHEPETWSFPALVGPYCYWRSDREIVCLRLE